MRNTAVTCNLACTMLLVLEPAGTQICMHQILLSRFLLGVPYAGHAVISI